MPKDYICVIGAANVDITGFAHNKLVLGDSSIGHLTSSTGGVGRNIAENLVRLGVPVKLLCPIGDDIYGKEIIQNCEEVGIDISEALFLENTGSSVFLGIMDKSNDLALAIAAMSICTKIDKAFIDAKREQIKNANAVVLETNIPVETLEYIIESIPDQTYILDTVAGDKAGSCMDVLHGLHSLKTNQIEAEILSGIEIKEEPDLERSAAFFHKKGVKNVFITIGKKGSFYSNQTECGIVVPKPVLVANTIGAGDAFLSGLVFGRFKDYNLVDSVKIAGACANMAVMSEKTVNPEINEKMILEQALEQGITNTE